MSHEAQSLPDLVEKLVKNWEVEASFKTDLKDWRTIDRSKYTFSVNGGPKQTGEHMLEVGTYNAIIEANDHYCPVRNNFDVSHKVFKRMMPTFAWEVLEVYSGPPTVAFRWRHWGEMKSDYSGINEYELPSSLPPLPPPLLCLSLSRRYPNPLPSSPPPAPPHSPLPQIMPGPETDVD